jgi:hypothetical protein
MSWKPEVQVKGEGDKWHANALVFATKAEAESCAQDTYSRWTLATAHRAVESDHPVNYVWVNGKAVHLELQS